MSASKPEEDHPSSRNLDDIESPRKRMRLDTSGRKSWSLMDRKTDHEVLQEMGVSLLEPDDCEVLCDPGTSGMMHKSLKRKRDIENVNPNIKLVTSPLSKFSPKSPRVKTSSPNPGPSRLRSPRSGEKHPLQPTDQQLLETTLMYNEYLIDEETPVAQSVSAQYLPAAPGAAARPPRHEHTPLISSSSAEPRGACAAGGEGEFDALSDEMVLSVFRWLPKRTLAHCMLVCKRWHRVACDETLWQRLDLGNKTLAKDAIGRILARKPFIVRLASSEIGEWHPPTIPEPSRIQYLDLSMATVDTRTLDNLLHTCPHLSKLSVESVQLADSTCQLIGKCSKLETLNLTMAQGITAEGLKFIMAGCTSLQSLNISWCNLDEACLEVLVTMLPQRLQRLNLSGARILTDQILERLSTRCPRLVELDVSDCGRLTARAALALAALHRLEHLATSRCYLLPAHALYKLGGSPALQYLDVWGMLHTHALSALRTALPHVTLNNFMFSELGGSPALQYLDVWGMLHTHALSALRTALPHVTLNNFMFSELGGSPALQYLDVWGMLHTHALSALRTALPHVTLNNFMFSELGGSPALQYLDVWGMLHTHALSALRTALPHVTLNNFMFSELGGSPALQYLDVWGMLHTHALSALRTALPHVTLNNFMFSELGGSPALQYLDVWGMLHTHALSALRTALPHVTLNNFMFSELGGSPALQYLDVWGMLHTHALSALRTALPHVTLNNFMFSELGGSPALQYLDVWGMLHTHALSALRTALPHVTLNNFMFSELGGSPALQYLDVWGMLHTHALSALRTALPHVTLNNFMFSAVARPTVGARRTSIWGLRTRD